MNRYLLGFFFFGSVIAWAELPRIVWPTPDSYYFDGGDFDEIVQPTSSGTIESALFGCVRNHGRRFHEGIDLKPLVRDKRGEASDTIFTVMDGRIRYVNTRAGNSSYGRYIVIEHEDADVPVYSLYAHLAKISPEISVGGWVKAGDSIGTMGRSAGGYRIPPQRAHLHFEIGLLKSNHFQKWYDWRNMKGKNHHGIYNGMNLIGMNPVHFFEAVRGGEIESFAHYIKGLPTAFTLRILTRKIPDFIVRYPQLLTRKVKTNEVLGWYVQYTWYGLPKSWTPLTAKEIKTSREGEVALMFQDEKQFADKCRSTLLYTKDSVKIGHSLKKDLQLIFGFR